MRQGKGESRLISPKLAAVKFNKPWKGRKLTGPNGYVEIWQKDTPPTPEDLDAIVAKDKDEYERRRSTGKVGIGGVAKGRNIPIDDPSLASPRINLPKKSDAQLQGYFRQQAGAAQAPVTTPKVQQEAKSKVTKILNLANQRDEAGRHLDSKGNVIPPWTIQTGKDIADVTHKIIRGATRPITEPVGRIMGAFPGAGQLAARALGYDPMELGATVAPQVAAGVVNTPVNVFANAGNMLFAADKTPGDILRSGTNLAVDLSPAVIGKVASAGVKAVKGATKTGRIDKALSAIPDDAAQFAGKAPEATFRPNPKAKQPVQGFQPKELPGYETGPTTLAEAGVKPMVRAKGPTQQPTAKSTQGTEAVWRNQDVDQPVILTGKVETYKDGRRFAEVEIDGQKSWVPENEVIKPKPPVQPGGRTTGISMASREIDAEKGLRPNPESIKSGVSNEDVFNEAKKNYVKGSPHDTLTRLAESQSPASRKQAAEFDIESANYQRELDIASAQLDADPTNDLLRAKYNATVEKIADFDKKLDIVKGENGRSLQMFKAGANIEDMSYTQIVREAKRRYDVDLSPKQAEQFKKIQKDLDEANISRAAAEKKLQDIEASFAKDRDEAVAKATKELQDLIDKQAGRRVATATRKAKIDSEIADLKSQWANRGGGTQKSRRLRGGSVDLDPETYQLIARAASLYMQKGVVKLEELANSLVEAFEGLTHVQAIRAIGNHFEKPTRIISEAAKATAETKLLAKHSAKLNDALSGVVQNFNKSEPSQLAKELRKSLKDTLEAQGLNLKGESLLNPIRKRIAKLADKLEKGYRDIPTKQAASEELKALQNEAAGLQADIKLKDALYNLEDEFRSGNLKPPNKKAERVLSREMQNIKAKVESLRKQKAVRLKALEPQGYVERINKIARDIQLTNPEARIMDIASNSVKMTAHVAQNPLRSLIGNLLFSKTTGRETLRVPFLSWRKTKMIFENAPSRWKQETLDTLRGLDMDALEKYGSNQGIITRATGVTDVPFRDAYYRMALDDWAVTAAKNDAGKRTKIWKQLTEGTDGPLTDAEVLEAKTLAHDWSLRQTYNVDNLASTISKGLKEMPARWIETSVGGRVGKETADTWRFLVDSITRFSRVIGNVVLEKGNYVYGLQEAAVRLGAAKAQVGLLGKIPAKDARLITDLAARGLTGIAIYELGKSSYNYLQSQDWMKGEIVTTDGGTKFVRWTLFPELYGGMDAGQLGGALSALLRGATDQLIAKADLTEKQKASLASRYERDQLLNQPLTSGPTDLARVGEGQKSVGEYAGSLVARQAIPGGISRFAERQDEQQTGVKLRKTSTFWDEFLKRIPKTPLNPDTNRQSLPSNQKSN